jgi:hypothetical protein
MLACDICGPAVTATVIRPVTRNRPEVLHYCADHARRYLGWGDTYRRMTEEDHRHGRTTEDPRPNDRR